jgi:hypothetical protein
MPALRVNSATLAARDIRSLAEASLVSFAMHAHTIAPNQDNSELSPMHDGRAALGIVFWLQIWVIANALIFAWALWPARPEEPQVEPLTDATPQANKSAPAAVNFT